MKRIILLLLMFPMLAMAQEAGDTTEFRQNRFKYSWVNGMILHGPVWMPEYKSGDTVVVVLVDGKVDTVSLSSLQGSGKTYYPGDGVSFTGPNNDTINSTGDGGISRTELGDTANVIRSDFPIKTVDESLFIDSNKVLKGNISSKIDQFTYDIGDSKVFQLTRKPSKVIQVLINGVVYDNSLTEWNLTTADSTLEVLIAMGNDYEIGVYYQYLGTDTGQTANTYSISEARAEELDQQIYNQIVADYGISTAPSLCLPDKIEVTAGHTIQLYKYPMVVAYNPDIYNVQVVSDSINGVDYIGDDYERYWEYVTTGACDFNIEVKMYDNTGTIIDSATVAISVLAAPTSPASNQNVLFIGDSYTFFNRIPDEFARVAKSADAATTYNDYYSTYTAVLPAGKSLTNITLIGTQKNNPVGWTGSEFHEGYSGKTWEFFGQDATSPFVYSGSIDFNQYLTDNAFTAPSVIYIGLGWNDILKIMTTPNDTATVKTDMKLLLDSINSQLPSAKVYIWTPSLPSLLGGAGEHPFGSSPQVDVFLWKLSLTNLYKMYQNVANQAAYSSFCKVIGAHVMVDSPNMMRMAPAPKNTRITDTEIRGLDDVHPSDAGFFQISDACLQSFFYNHCQ